MSAPHPGNGCPRLTGVRRGPLLGGVIGTLGTFAAGTTGFLLCRVNERAARFLVGEQGMELGQRFFANQGGWVIALSRWTILLPELLSCYAGLMRMPARHICRATVRLRAHEFYLRPLGSTDAAQENKLRTRLKRRNASDSLGSLSWWQKKRRALSSCAANRSAMAFHSAVAGTASSKRSSLRHRIGGAHSGKARA